MPRSRNERLGFAIDAYLQRITNAGASPVTVKHAEQIIRRFQRDVASRGDTFVHAVTAADANAHFYGPTGLSGRAGGDAVNTYRAYLKSFFDFCCLMGWADSNPIVAVARAKPSAPRKRLMLNAGELLSLLEHCHNPVERIGCALGMNTGLRANDIRHLTIQDANVAGGVIQTEIRKTRKLDIKPITLELHNELMRWFATYADLMGCEVGELHDDWLLMPSYYIDPQMRVYLRPETCHTRPSALVQRPLGRMGFPVKHEGFHTLRRSSARALFESLRDGGEGRDHALMIVKEFLNHSSTTQTEHYLGLNQERVIRDTLLKDRPFLTTLAGGERARMAKEAM